MTFNSTNLLQPQCFDISINDDELVEVEETFTVTLSLQNNPRGQVELQNSSANISIADNDGTLTHSISIASFSGSPRKKGESLVHFIT